MSHFTHVQTKLSDLELIRECLADMGLQVELGDHPIRGWYVEDTRRRNSIFAVRHDDEFIIGFERTQEGSLAIHADWEYVQRRANLNPTEFLNNLNQRYAYKKVTREARALGFEVVEQEVQKDQAIRVVIRKW